MLFFKRNAKAGGHYDVSNFRANLFSAWEITKSYESGCCGIKDSEMDFRELSNKRFSVRKYTDEPVSDADIEYIMECVRLAPSACNKQPWKFLLLTSDEAKGKIRQCYDRPWFATAPLYFLCMKSTDGSWVRPDDGKSHGDIDLGIAVEHLCLAAADRGLGTCWVCNYDVAAVERLFHVDGFEAVAIIPAGHVAADCPKAEKKRKVMAEIVERQ